MSETGASLPFIEPSELPSEDISWESLILETAAIVEREIDERHAVGKYTTKDLRDARARLSEERAHLADPAYPKNFADMRQMMQVSLGTIERYNPKGRLKSFWAEDALRNKLSQKRLS